MLIPSLKRNTNAVVPWQWHAPLDLTADNELSQPLIFTQCEGFWVCVWGGGGGVGRFGEWSEGRERV